MRDPDHLGDGPLLGAAAARLPQQARAIGLALEIRHALLDQPALEIQVQHRRLLSSRPVPTDLLERIGYQNVKSNRKFIKGERAQAIGVRPMGATRCLTTSIASSTRRSSWPVNRMTSSRVWKFGYEPTETSGCVVSSSRMTG